MNEKKSWWLRLKDGLKKTSDTLEDGLKNVFVRKRLDQETLDELEELLILSDMGVETASKLTQALSKEKMDKDITLEEIKEFLAERVTSILIPYTSELSISKAHHPHVILVVGVNGSGKTTTIGKLAKQWHDVGHKVRLAACDTFRAAAVEQLQVWANRSGIPVSVGKENADAAALAFEALQLAKEEGSNILMIDTAGRLHNKAGLMDELKKLTRVIQKLEPSAPHSVLLVLDATTGQNAHAQVQTFKEMIGVTGLIVTKLDGTAKGGVVVSLCEKFKLPIHAIGVGESIDDLRPFTASDFARTLISMD
ncbi:signal recognition particle-docking protein FtsY [Candidatus Odyssella acanthamoebae]|uniref:Signal recognition particle receptor FtsY n=1 Tax=Candidatus Odyssella acanthamoebae TaxID=91604 RepID=A0A077AXR5_9PROT|nr:signal recognition particle-docking protein FtsY [Candidatus Paracaedibacter acanthamoebae]AIK96794.1 cell division protein FtsY [Candidatus Paracaedibacter acanthamoebae]